MDVHHLKKFETRKYVFLGFFTISLNMCFALNIFACTFNICGLYITDQLHDAACA